MTLVIESTLPFARKDLEFAESDEWTRLLPLIRPSLERIKLPSGQSILIDRSLNNSNAIKVVVVCSLYNISSKLLSDRRCTGFIVIHSPATDFSSVEIYDTLADNGIKFPSGLVIATSSNERSLKCDLDHESGWIEISLEGEMELDHVVCLISAAETSVRSNADTLLNLLKLFVAKSLTKSFRFDKQMLDGSLSIRQGAESSVVVSARASVRAALSEVVDQADESYTWSVHYADVDGLSKLEAHIIAHEIADYLNEKGLGYFITSSSVTDNTSRGRGWAFSACSVPRKFLMPQETPSLKLPSTQIVANAAARSGEKANLMNFSDDVVRRKILRACECIIKEEPTITEYDTIVGDGDCGYTLRDGAKQVLSFIGDRDLAQLPQALGALVDDLEEEMGGTSGALYCIFLSSFAQSLILTPSIPDALAVALEHLLKYTSARLGDRTLLDCLIPFVDTWKSTGNVREALQESQKGVQGTNSMEAKLGRSSYLDESATQGVPDPGAYGLYILLAGLVNG